MVIASIFTRTYLFSRPCLLICLLASSALVAASPIEVSLWRHMAGENEMLASISAIKRFNNSQDRWEVVPDFVPESAYRQSISAAAGADLLPCIIDIDQPLVPYFAWKKALRPLDGLIEDKLLRSINASGKGTYQSDVYSVGQFDVALLLFSRHSLLNKLSLRIPTEDKPWTREEFENVLSAMQGTGQFDAAIDLRAYDNTEWISYAWGPLMRSWGADLIDRSTYVDVDGVLNSNEAVDFGHWLQMLVAQGLISNELDDKAFVDGRVGLLYGGSWMLRDLEKELGDDLAILPVPDLGNGIVIGGGSWHWAITSTCNNINGAKEFISFLLRPQELARVSDFASLFPTSPKAAELTKDYSLSGKWRDIYELSEKYAQLRPETPAYAIISTSFRKAMLDIINGMPPTTALGVAVENIETAMARNGNFD